MDDMNAKRDFRDPTSLCVRSCGRVRGSRRDVGMPQLGQFHWTALIEGLIIRCELHTWKGVFEKEGIQCM